MLSRSILTRTMKMGVVFTCCLGAASLAEAQQRRAPQSRTTTAQQRSQAGSASTRGVPARTASASRTAPATRKPVSPQLEKMLKDWYQSSKLIKRLEGVHRRRIYDKVFHIEKRADGQFFYESPDRGRIDINEHKLKKGDVSQRTNPKNGQPYKLQSDNPEMWICDGKQIFAVNRNEKQAEVFEIPEESQGVNIMNSPLPFLFGMPPEVAKRRYDMQLQESSDDQKWVQLQATPRMTQDIANWKSAKIILDRKSFLPLHVQLTDPTGNTITVYSFGNMIVNKPARFGIFKQQPFKPRLVGYKVNVHNKDTAIEEQQKRQRQMEGINAQLDKSKQRKDILPDVRGYAYKDAQQRLEAMGLKVKLFKGPVARSEKLVHTVASQTPSAMSKIPGDKTVTLRLFTRAKTASK